MLAPGGRSNKFGIGGSSYLTLRGDNICMLQNEFQASLGSTMESTMGKGLRMSFLCKGEGVRPQERLSCEWVDLVSYCVEVLNL